MKNILKLEEAAMLALCVYFLIDAQVPWWCYLLLVLGPDISMLGYLGGNLAGAFLYNLFHHKGIAIGIMTIGFYLREPGILIAGVLLFGHSSMDRMFGYGLKTTAGFKFTHLGMIGKDKS